MTQPDRSERGRLAWISSPALSYCDAAKKKKEDDISSGAQINQGRFRPFNQDLLTIWLAEITLLIFSDWINTQWCKAKVTKGVSFQWLVGWLILFFRLSLAGFLYITRLRVCSHTSEAVLQCTAFESACNHANMLMLSRYVYHVHRLNLAC